MNAGCGMNKEVGCKGSPLVYYDNLDKAPRYHHAFFVDRDSNCISELAERFRNRPNAYCFNVDNRELLPIVEEMMMREGDKPQFAFGSLIIDPNGYDTGWPVDVVQEFARTHPRIDIILNLNMRSFYCQRAHVLSGKGRWKDRRMISPSEWPAFLNRPFGVVREVSSGSGSRFILMCLRSIRGGISNAMGMYDIHSQHGRSIFERADKNPEVDSNPTTPSLPGLS
jgi:hypothetical protein